MKYYQCDDLFGVLERLVERNVQHYKTDFNYDKEILENACNDNDKDFIWFTRDNGTQCVNERLAFIDGTYGNAECATFLKEPSAMAFYVHVDGLKDGKVSGCIYPVDAKVLHEEIEKNQVPAHQVWLTPKEGESFAVPYEDYNNKASFYYREYDVVRKDYLLTDNDERKVEVILQKHKEDRRVAKEGKITDLVGEKETKNRFQYQDLFGIMRDVEAQMDMYVDNNNLYLGLNYYDEECKCMLPYGDVTVNVGDLPYLHSAIDTNNNGNNIVQFLEKNGFGELTGTGIQSGFCVFPVFKFYEEKLKGLFPKKFEKYEKAYGKGKSLAEKIEKANAGCSKSKKESKKIEKEVWSDIVL